MACAKFEAKSGEFEIMPTDWKKISLDLFLKIYPFYKDKFSPSQKHIEIKPFSVELPGGPLLEEDFLMFLDTETDLGSCFDLNVFLYHCKIWAYKTKGLNIRETLSDVSVLDEEDKIIVCFVDVAESVPKEEEAVYQAVPYSLERLVLTFEWIVKNITTVSVENK